MLLLTLGGSQPNCEIDGGRDGEREEKGREREREAAAVAACRGGERRSESSLPPPFTLPGRHDSPVRPSACQRDSLPLFRRLTVFGRASNGSKVSTDRDSAGVDSALPSIYPSLPPSVQPPFLPLAVELRGCESLRTDADLQAVGHRGCQGTIDPLD